MHMQQAFLDDIIAHPDDDAPRLIFADWLEEHGEPERAEFIRVQIELARLPEDDPRQPGLQLRQWQLLREHGNGWHPPFGGYAERVYQRGFIEEITAPGEWWVREGKKAFQRYPLRQIRLRYASPQQVEVLARWPELRRLEALDLSADPTSPYAQRIRAAGAASLARGISPLRALNLTHQRIGDAGLVTLSRSSDLRRLETLRLASNDIGAIGEGLETLVESVQPGRLAVLDLRGNPLGVLGVQALAKWPGLAGVRRLDLRACQLHLVAVRALGESPHLGEHLALLLASGPFVDLTTTAPLRERLKNRLIVEGGLR